MRNTQQGFTLIELIVVIVILGILSITALPKFVDLTTEAEEASANGVLGAAQGACAITFAQNRAQKNTSASYIDDGTALLAALSPAPTGWTANLATIEWDSDGDATADYTITVTAETATAPCSVVGSW